MLVFGDAYLPRAKLGSAAISSESCLLLCACVKNRVSREKCGTESQFSKLVTSLSELLVEGEEFGRSLFPAGPGKLSTFQQRRKNMLITVSCILYNIICILSLKIELLLVKMKKLN
jgi:hypothetical protein